jgi:hypothetical protein
MRQVESARQVRAYIDIDGVLIRPDGNGREVLIPRFEQVLGFLKANFDCYWLTTNVTQGSGGEGASRRLGPYLRDTPIDRSILEGIKPTAWKTWKTEAIDFSGPFIWLDDDAFPHEREVLREKGCSESLVEIDWRKRANRLTVRRLKRIRRNLLRAASVSD